VSRNLHAFEQLFKSLFKPLCAFATKYVGDTDEAKNIVHEIFVALWEKYETLPADTNYKSYLYTSARNRCLNYIRDKKKHLMLEQLTDHPATELETALEATELENKIDHVVQSLPEKCRMVFEMNRIEGLKYAQIAEKMQISIKTVEAQMSKALSILREQLKEFITIILFLLMG
jgi:RNA polymerase sigma-70 factor, ECF subfamily